MVVPAPDDPERIAAHIAALLDLPRDQQVARARALIASLPPSAPPEAWNSTFGPGSLFEAWTATGIARSVHTALADEIAPFTKRPGFRIVDVGGGNGSLWRSVLDGSEEGEIVVVDLLEEAVRTVREAVPEGIAVRGIVSPVQHADLPACDALVCSMTLHHVAGRDAADRAAHGLAGPGKLEVLRSFGEALRERHGTGFLVEADVDCDLDLPPGDTRLADNIFDSYVRRCARAILEDLEDASRPAELRERWGGLLRHWFLEQLAVVDVPIADRDVYELTVPRWKSLLRDAGLALEAHRGIDRHALFQLYRFRS